MKSTIFLKDKNKDREIMQIDLAALAKHPEEVEDIVDILIAESRRNEKSISFEKAKEILKAKGKL
ncbi:MAG: hypothetical protein JNM14_02060 [Ferruginibacter sp.]|nr:hypothetical protein [Ferruginibacter sp.]